jgi:hypothetical protein
VRRTEQHDLNAFIAPYSHAALTADSETVVYAGSRLSGAFGPAELLARNSP